MFQRTPWWRATSRNGGVYICRCLPHLWNSDFTKFLKTRSNALIAFNVVYEYSWNCNNLRENTLGLRINTKMIVRLKTTLSYTISNKFYFSVSVCNVQGVRCLSVKENYKLTIHRIKNITNYTGLTKSIIFF